MSNQQPKFKVGDTVIHKQDLMTIIDWRHGPDGAVLYDIESDSAVIWNVREYALSLPPDQAMSAAGAARLPGL